MRDTDLLPPATPSLARLIDQTCDRFEAAWKSGQRPRPEEFLAALDEPARSALLRQLLLLDWDYRRRAGESPSAADYVARWPDYTAIIEEVSREMTASTSPSAGGQSRDAEAPADAPVDAAGRYDLLSEIGRGGIGVVYRGHDRTLGRELAIKVLRDSYRDRPDARRRFKAEARVGSQLQHPAIVPVYEMGRFGEDLPYITMKLVEGRTLAALLAERADLGQDLPRFLSVFEQMCQAMAYAHSKGVIHRDLKPANVMVGAFGEVQVMDWGFAKIADGDEPATDRMDGISAATPADGTQSGVLMGTPAYMPPEQARGETARIDERADVFAFGAILCEILSGRPAYSGSGDNVCHMAAAGDLADTHARLTACGADTALRELATRCLAADRDARPRNAGEVTRVMTAHLASAQERVRQAEVKRAAAEARATSERRARWMALGLAAALLIGAGIAGWQALIATRATSAAVAAVAGETAAKETAQAKEGESRAVLEFVQDRVFAAARPRGQPNGLGPDVTLRRAVEAAVPFVDKSFANQPLVEARLRTTLGMSFAYLGDDRRAGEQFDKALSRYQTNLGPDAPETLRCTTNLASSYVMLGKNREALGMLEEILPRTLAAGGEDSEDTIRVLHNMANALGGMNRADEALALREKTHARAKAALGAGHPYSLKAMNNLAVSYSTLGRANDAVKLCEQTYEAMKEQHGPRHPDTLASMGNLANFYAAVGRHDDAIRLRKQALPIYQAELGADNPDTLMAMGHLASSYDAAGRLAEGIPLREQALEEMTRVLGRSDPRTLAAMHIMAARYADARRHADALKMRRETLDLRQKQLGIDDPDTLMSMWAVAASLVESKRGTEAIPIIDKCLQLVAGKKADPVLLEGVVGLRLGHFEDTKDVAGCRATAEIWENLHGTDAHSLYLAAANRAVVAKVIHQADMNSIAAADATAELDRAMAWLTQSVAAGFKKVKLLKKDKDLNPLRERPDFQKLLASLERQTGP